VVNKNQTQTSLGPGNRWKDVYSHLDPLGLSVIGGRVADIGVGGLTLGGGVSFYSGRYGFACDNVNNYQVVFADGSIHDVNLKTHPDLYWALRGGGNNFGIVTRFDVLTFPQGDLWGGSIYWPENDNTTSIVTNALADFNVNAADDIYAAVILAFGYVQAEGLWLVVGQFEYGKPVENPPILNNFTSITPQVLNSMTITNLTQITLDESAVNPSGQRETYWAASFKNNAELMQEIYAIFVEEVAAIANASGLLPACVFQPVTEPIISQMAKNGGNALGITTEDAPLILLNIAISWSSALDDVAVIQAANNTITRAVAAAECAGLEFRWIYQNYAAQTQKVFEGYGEENHLRLKKIQKKYDPEGVWERLQPGYFKL